MRIKKQSENIVRVYDTLKLKEEQGHYVIYGYLNGKAYRLATPDTEKNGLALFDKIVNSTGLYIVDDKDIKQGKITFMDRGLLGI